VQTEHLPLRVDGNVEASRPHAHGRSIRGIDPSIQPATGELQRPIVDAIETPSAVALAATSHHHRSANDRGQSKDDFREMLPWHDSPGHNPLLC
jgi:hypothetical protein